MIDPTSTSPSVLTNQTVPPVSPPSKPTRVLLLTDSIHASTPTHIFEAIPNHVCVKKKEFQLANIDQYSSEFAYTDIAILSMGINDLSRYNHNAGSLASTVVPLLRQYSRQFPHCKFVFNSLLLTRDYNWLNSEIDVFNNLLLNFHAAQKTSAFFDSDRFAGKCYRETPSIPSFYAQNHTNNGIHISFHMRRLISSELVRCVGYLSGTGGPRFRRCEWVRNVNSCSS